MKTELKNAQSLCRTVLIERETLFRSALARIIELTPGFQLAGDFSAVCLADEACRALAPELLMINVDGEPEESVSFIEMLAQRQPQTRVLALSRSDDPALLGRLLDARIYGFVPRDEPLETLEEAMTEVAGGYSYLPARFVRRCREHARQAKHLLQELTNNEREILARVAAGQTSKEIAGALGLSPRSVETYRGRMLRKLQVPNAAAMIDLAVRSGLRGVGAMRWIPESYNHDSAAQLAGAGAAHISTDDGGW